MKVAEAEKDRRCRNKMSGCIKQLGKEQTSLSCGGFPISARFATARRHEEAFSSLVFVSL